MRFKCANASQPCELIYLAAWWRVAQSAYSSCVKCFLATTSVRKPSLA